MERKINAPPRISDWEQLSHIVQPPRDEHQEARLVTDLTDRINGIERFIEQYGAQQTEESSVDDRRTYREKTGFSFSKYLEASLVRAIQDSNDKYPGFDWNTVRDTYLDLASEVNGELNSEDERDRREAAIFVERCLEELDLTDGKIRLFEIDGSSPYALMHPLAKKILDP